MTNKRSWINSAVFAGAVVLAAFLPGNASAQTYGFQWAERVASTINPDNEFAHGLAIDTSANLYVTGWFDGTNDFGDNVILTNTPGGGQDIFVAKYNSAGTPQWARRAGGNAPSRDAGRGVGVDNAGNVYVTGRFFGSADFGNFTLTTTNTEEFFLAKYNSTGSVLWARQSIGGRPGATGDGGGTGVYGTGLAVDAVGNCYALGYADPRATITFETTSLPVQSGYDLSTFLVKYDSTGAAQWAQWMGGAGKTYSTAVTLDGSGYVYVAGSFEDSVNIGPTNLTSAGAKDGFVAKFNSNGDFQWASQMSGSTDGGSQALSADTSGSVYVAGGFGNTAGDTITFGPSLTLTNVGGGFPGAGVGDAFLAKYDGSNGVAQWAVRAGGPNTDAYAGLSTDSHGNIFVGGLRGSNAVVAKYDGNGCLQWTQSSSGPNGAIVFAGPLVDAAGNCYVAGWFQTNAVFGTNTLTGRGYWDFFLAKVRFAPLALGIGWSNSMALLSVYGDIGIRFALESVPALRASNSWDSLVTNTLTSNPLIHTDTNSVGSPRRFYRARLVP